MIFFPLFFGPFFALKKFGFPLKAGDAVFPRSWPEGVCRPLLRYALRYSLTWDKRHKHEIPGEVLSAKQSHEWDNLIPPAAQRLPETSAAAWSSSRGPVTQIWELVSNHLLNIVVVSAVWVFGGDYLHQARVLCLAGLFASDRALTGRAREEMIQQHKVKQRCRVLDEVALREAGCHPVVDGDAYLSPTLWGEVVLARQAVLLKCLNTLVMTSEAPHTGRLCVKTDL